MPEQLYVIKWKSIYTGKEGQGTGRFPKNEAQRYASELNKKDKDLGLTHWIEPWACTGEADQGPAK